MKGIFGKDYLVISKRVRFKCLQPAEVPIQHKPFHKVPKCPMRNV